MPNTEVKLSSAENTWMETSWEDREVLTFIFCSGLCHCFFVLYKTNVIFMDKAIVGMYNIQKEVVL